MTVAQARRALADAFRAGRPRLARARCAPAGRPCARPRPHRADGRRRPQPRRRRSASASTRSPRGGSTREPVARILGVKEFWGLPLRLNAGDAGAAAGDRDRGRGGARRDRRRRAAHARAAHRRSRHRLGRAAARAAARIAERHRHRHRHRAPRRSAAARDNAGRLGLGARAEFVACDFGAALDRPLRPRRQQSALHRERRDRHACRPRCGTIRAARSMAAPTASTAIAPLRDRRRACSRPTAIWWSNSASARNRRLPRCSARRGLRPRRRAPICPASRARCMRVLPQ